ncbi:MAG: VOC family protein [Parasphingorhabdus sp.]|uniref:VOC family protein n=1 Tax=Parasphingorhabdus sp. TaxID=2709688 RepID=UPI003262D5F7
MNTSAAGTLRPFHLAFPVRDLEEARTFYGELLGCEEGRSAPHWIDFNLFGHQIVAHLDAHFANRAMNNAVDGEQVPVPHFGVVMTMAGWQTLADRLKAANTDFIIHPTVRFKGQAGEQATMFFCDPSGNALEFKAFGDDGQLFAKD